MKKISIILMAITTLIACHSEAPAPTAAKEETALPPNIVSFTEAQLKNAALAIDKPMLKTLSGVLKVNGKIDVPPQNYVSVSFPLGGYLKTTKLLEGMPVKKGETIAVLEDPAYIEMQQEYLTAKAKFEYLQLEVQRQMELSKENINPTKLLQQAQSDYKIQDIMIKSLAQKLKLININPDKLTTDNITRTVNISSPINGYVAKVNVHIGKYLAPTDAMFELINTSDIHASLTIFEKDLTKIKIGQEVMISLPNFPDREYPAEIILIGRTLDESRAAEVHCHFKRYDMNLIPGMFLNAAIRTTENNSLTVPNEAIVHFENKDFVFIAKDSHTFEMTEVKLGTLNQELTAITSADGKNLANLDIVTKNAYTILSKMKNAAEEE